MADDYGITQYEANFIWAVGANGTILKNIPDWLKYQYPADGFGLYPLNSVYFTDVNNGFIAGNYQIMKTTDSGITWFISYGNYNDTLTSVYFTDANTGYVVGNAGKIMKTTDSGINWNTLSSGTALWLSSVYFTDSNTGYVVGRRGTILKTTNGGTNWDTLSSGTALWLRSVYFTDSNTGYVVGQMGIILKTTNSGTDWTIQYTPGGNWLKSVNFIDADTGYTCGYDNLYKTTNGGADWWNPINSWGGIGYFQFQSVHFIDAYIGYVSVYDGIYKSIDGGNNWFKEHLRELVDNGISAMGFVVENNTAVGFSVGKNILRTSFEYLGGEPIGNSGSYPGWVPVNSGTIGGISGVDYINPFVAFAVGGESVFMNWS